VTRSLALLLAIALAAVSSPVAGRPQAQAAGRPSIVRGYLYRMTSQGQVPAGGIALRLRSPQYGVSAQAQTAGGSQRDGGGMYYFYNVQPGDYALDVLVSAKEIYQLTTVHVRDQPNEKQPVTDVPPMAVR